MATVAQVAKASLQKIVVAGSEAPMEPDEYQDYIFAMNAFMADLAANGVALGYTMVDNLADEVTIPTGALRGLIYNMAVEVAPEYGGTVTPECALIAQAGLKTMRQIGQSIPRSYYPSTLPLGSGNYNLQWGLTSFYYPDREPEILGETSGSIALESGTIPSET